MTGKAARKDAHLWERDPHDWYVEPKRATLQLLTREAFPGWTHDPCCGGGNIVETLLAAGYPATGSDLVQRIVAPWFVGTGDFLADGLPYKPDNIVTNPPYYGADGAERAIRRALDLVDGRVAAFVDARFLFGQARAAGLYYEHPPSVVYFLGTRPSCPPGAWLEAGNVAGGGQQNFAWLTWAHRPGRMSPGSRGGVEWLP
jgi:hypothetical protein